MPGTGSLTTSLTDTATIVRMLLSHRFFWPDSPPYASMLRAIGEHLANLGNSVTVLSAQPSYRPGASVPRQPARETLDGIKVRRIALLQEERKDLLIRGCNAVLYSLRMFFHIATGTRYDVVMVSTFPPVLLGFVACLACRIRGSQFIYHCMDIHPEVSMVGRDRPGGMWLTLLQKLDGWTCRNAAAVVVLSEDMRQTLLARSADAKMSIRIINNFELPHFECETDAEASVSFPQTTGVAATTTSVFRVVFAGNLGRFQSLDTVVRAAASLQELDDLQIVLMGDGVMLNELRELVAELDCRNVNFMPFQNVTVAKRLIAQADFGLVTLRRGMHRVAFPSKTMTYLAAGCPVIVMVDPDSELGQMVVSDRLGLLVPDETPLSLAKAIRLAYERRTQWRGESVRLRAYANDRNSAGTAFCQWEALFASIQ